MIEVLIQYTNTTIITRDIPAPPQYELCPLAVVEYYMRFMKSKLRIGHGNLMQLTDRSIAMLHSSSDDIVIVLCHRCAKPKIEVRRGLHKISFESSLVCLL